jgi:L-alanine-DL-glutamate epimerase-like enolase superfamily enzyme
MKIKRVDVFPLKYEEPNDDNAVRSITLVRIEAGDGIVGWGECIAQFPESSAAVAAMLTGGLTDAVIGFDPLDIDLIIDALHQRVWWYGDVGGTAYFAISAIDMALWDLKGKILGVPLHQLLGGKRHEKLPACASTHPKLPELDAMAEELAAHVRNGYKLVKVGFGKKGYANLGVDEARDFAFVDTVRAAIGPEAGFIVDVGFKSKWDIPRAVRFAHHAAANRLTWLEDPFPPRDLAAYRTLRSAVPELPVATGERLWNLDDYRQLLEARVCDVILADPGRVEGISGMQRIVQLAAQYSIGMDAHTWSSAINTAASIHVSLCAARPTIFELKPKQNPMQHELVTTPIAQQDGYIYAPEGAGLGVEVIEKTVEKYRMK